MDTMGTRLRHARERAGYKSAAEGARAVGVNVSTYRAHENSQNEFDPGLASVYGRAFRVRPAWLLTGEQPEFASVPAAVISGAKIQVAGSDDLMQSEGEVGGGSVASNAQVIPAPVQLARSIPVYGKAIGGEDGEFILNGNKVGDVLAPVSLSRVRDAYGVMVAGDSMEPRYQAGEVVFINPHTAVRKGDYVVAQIVADEHSPPLAYVKRFVRLSGGVLVLTQFNPAKELQFPRERVASVHKIIGSTEGL